MELWEAVLAGLFAGLVGTAAMTASQAVEIRFTGREPSMVPGQVGYSILRREPADQAGLARMNSVVHWVHGIGMGAVRGLLGLAGLGAVAGTAAHFALVWGGDVMLYMALGLAGPPWKWKGKDLATDLLHKGIYAVVTGLVFVLIT